MEKQRDFAVDIIKFMAVFLIINSHADMMYPHMSILATGGLLEIVYFCLCLDTPCFEEE